MLCLWAYKGSDRTVCSPINRYGGGLKKGVLYWLTLPLNSLNLLMRSMLSFFMDAITPGDES